MELVVTWMMVSQVMILLCGLCTAFLTTSMDYHRRRLAAPIGLLSQPFWIYSGIVTESWGMVAMSLLYGGRWLYVARRDLAIYLNEKDRSS